MSVHANFNAVVPVASLTLVATLTFSSDRHLRVTQASAYIKIGGAATAEEIVAITLQHRETGIIFLDVAGVVNAVNWNNQRGQDCPLTAGVTNHLDMFVWWNGTAAGNQQMQGSIQADEVYP